MKRRWYYRYSLIRTAHGCRKLRGWQTNNRSSKLKSGAKPGHSDGPGISLVFYSIAFILIVSIVVVSTGILALLSYAGFGFSFLILYLYVFSVAGSAIALALSLRGLIRSYQAILNSSSISGKTIILGAAAIVHNSGTQGQATPEIYYSPAEREIIDLIRDHGGRMLQSSLVLASALSSATVSRTITALENKGVLLRIRKGVTNELHLVETNFR